MRCSYAVRLMCVGFFLVASSLSFAQSDPQALAFAAQSIAALTGGTTVTDATLTGTATRTVGSDVGNGPATFYAKGQYESRIDLNLSSGNRSEIRNSLSSPQGEWIGSDSTPHAFALHNCITDAAWFFPALSSLAFATDPHQSLSYIGLEKLNGASVQHLRSIWSGQQLSTMDFYLDAATLLPVEVDFNAHPDDDMTTNIPFQILFSSYQNVNGAEIPYHIQELFSGDLLLDFTASGGVLNSGLSDSLFAIQ
jgi:hypothetical protein